MNCSTPSLPIHQHLPELTQTHAHWVGDAIQPAHPLSFPSPPALKLSQHQFSTINFLTHVQFFATPWTAAHQASPSIINSQSLFNSGALSWRCHLTISSSVIPPPPAFNCSQHQGLFQWVSYSHQVAKVLEFQFQHQSFRWIFRTDFLQDGLVWYPFSPRDSQESSSKQQFKSINSLALSSLYCSNLTSIHDYWKTFVYSKSSFD